MGELADHDVHTLAVGQAAPSALHAPVLDWVNPGAEPAWLTGAQAHAVAEAIAGAIRRDSSPATGALANAQARAQCLGAWIARALPDDWRTGWTIEVRTGALMDRLGSASPGARIVFLSPADAAHPQGALASAFVLAHEMAHTIARHRNRADTETLVAALGEARTRAVIASSSAQDLVDRIAGARINPDAPAARAREHEADAGALHLLHHAGVSLEGAPERLGWIAALPARAHRFARARHPQGAGRLERVRATAARLEARAKGDTVDPEHICKNVQAPPTPWYERLAHAVKRLVPKAHEQRLKH